MSVSPSPRIVVFGASGKVGQRLLCKLSELKHPTLSIGRRKDVLSRLPGESLVLDLANISASPSPIRSGDVVINAAHARHTATIADLCPPDVRRVIVLGSTRYLTRFPDAAADEVREAIKHLNNTKLPWVLLHPTMIYGANGENNVQRMASLIRRFHVIPLPGGGQSLIQPIHVDDVVEAVVRAIDADEATQRAIFIAGPAPMAYADFIRAIAHAIQCRVWVIPVPYWIIVALAWLSSYLPGTPTIKTNEVRRLLENKAVDIAEMQNFLGVFPRHISDGLAETLKKNAD